MTTYRTTITAILILLAGHVLAQSTIDPNYPDSHCSTTTTQTCVCAEAASGGTCAAPPSPTPGWCPGGEHCVPARLSGADFREKISGPARADIAALQTGKVTAPSSTTANRLARWSTSCGDTSCAKTLADSAWSLASSGAMVGGVNTSGGTAGLTVTQSGSGPVAAFTRTGTAIMLGYPDTTGGVYVSETGTNRALFIAYKNGGDKPAAWFSNGEADTGPTLTLVNLGTGPLISGVDLTMDTLGRWRATTDPPAVSSCGTSPSIAGTDSSGTVTTGTDTPTSCTLTFDAPWAETPRCVVSARAATPAVYVSAISETAVTLTLATGTDSLPIYYVCAY